MYFNSEVNERVSMSINAISKQPMFIRVQTPQKILVNINNVAGIYKDNEGWMIECANNKPLRGFLESTYRIDDKTAERILNYMA